MELFAECASGVVCSEGFKFTFAVEEETPVNQHESDSHSWAPTVEAQMLSISPSSADSLKQRLLHPYGLIQCIWEEDASLEDDRLDDIISFSDLERDVYEGGLKLWECALDLLDSLQTLCPEASGLNVLELGCGHGLPALSLLKRGANRAVFQDFNAQVLETVTAANLVSNLDPEMLSRCALVAGDWRDPRLAELILSALEERGADLILTSETIYNLATVPALLGSIDAVLSRQGRVLVAAKRFYFGVGGGTWSFLQELEKQGKFQVDHSLEFSDGKSNIREILVLSRKHSNMKDTFKA
jgi:SAM-dependent methyltransferase